MPPAVAPDSQIEFWVGMAVFGSVGLAFAIGFFGFPKLAGFRRRKRKKPGESAYSNEGILEYTGGDHGADGGADGGSH